MEEEETEGRRGNIGTPYQKGRGLTSPLRTSKGISSMSLSQGTHGSPLATPLELTLRCR